MPPIDPRPTKNQRRDEARVRAVALRKEQERATRRNRIIVLAVAGLAVVALVVAVVFALSQSSTNKAAGAGVAFGDDSDKVQPPALADVAAPSTADDGGGIPISDEGVGKAGAGDTTLSIYFDLQCPACKKFDEINAADLKTLAAESGITVIYQAMSFLDGASSGTYYSTRAGNALMVVADQVPDKFPDFVTALFADQPDEGTSGLTDTKIGEIAAQIGVPGDVIAHFTDTVKGTYTLVGSTDERPGTWRTYASFLAAATNHARDVLTGQGLANIATPTVLIDGKVVGGQTDADSGFFYNAGALAQRVHEVAAAKG